MFEGWSYEELRERHMGNYRALALLEGIELETEEHLRWIEASPRFHRNFGTIAAIRRRMRLQSLARDLQYVSRNLRTQNEALEKCLAEFATPVAA